MARVATSLGLEQLPRSHAAKLLSASHLQRIIALKAARGEARSREAVLAFCWDGDLLLKLGRVEDPSSVFGWSPGEICVNQLPLLLRPTLPPFLSTPKLVSTKHPFKKSKANRPAPTLGGYLFPICQPLALLSECVVVSRSFLNQEHAGTLLTGCRDCLAFLGGR